MRLVKPWPVILLLVGLTACSSSELTLTEYAAEVEALVAEMEADFAAADAAWEAQSPTKDGALDYWEERLEIREEFLEGIEQLNPPEDVVPMHDSSVDLFTRITAADQAIADSVAGYDTVTEHRPWLETPEGQASLAILEEVFAFCRSSQAEFDATADTTPGLDNPWIPAETQEIIKVAFGCPPQ